MEAPTFLFDNKKLIVEILEHIKDYKRMHPFKAARDKK